MLAGKRKLINDCDAAINKLENTVRNSCKLISMTEMKRDYLKDQYPEQLMEDCRREYGLSMEEERCFIAWPVFLGERFDEINICAVNLGISTLYPGRDTGSSEFPAGSYLESAINTLVVTSLTDQKNGMVLRFWPTHIDYTNRVEYGTIIQSVLTLSTLLNVGFLSKDRISCSGSDPETVRRNRVRFVMEALNWLLYLGDTGGPAGCAWSYAEDCIEAGTEKRITNAILPSEYSFEALQNYYELFAGEEELCGIVTNLDPGFLPRVRRSCDSYMAWFKREQFSNGGFRKNSNRDTVSFPFSCCTLSFFAYAGIEADDRSQPAFRLINYLFSGTGKFTLSFHDVCDTYKFMYQASQSRGYINDAYEIFPEAVLFLNSCRLLDKLDEALPSKYKLRLRQINYRALESILRRVCSIEMGMTGKSLVVKGRNEAQGFHYPIYAITYVKQCLEVFLRHESGEKKQVSYIALPPLLDGKTILISAALICLVTLAGLISLTDTITSIILSIASLLAPILVRLVIGKAQGPGDR